MFMSELEKGRSKLREEIREILLLNEGINNIKDSTFEQIFGVLGSFSSNDFLVEENSISIKEEQLQEQNEAYISLNEELTQIVEELSITSQELERQRVEKQIILDSISEMVIYHDLNLKVLWANRAATEMINKRIDEIIEVPCYQNFSNFSEPCPECPVAITIKSKESTSIELIKDDGRIWRAKSLPAFDRHGNIIGVVEIVKDVTNEKKAEEKLRISHQTYKGILDSISESVYIQDEKGVFLEVNQTALNFYNLKREDILGKTPVFLSAQGKNDINEIAKLHQKAFNGEPQCIEFWGKKADGTIFPKEVTLSPGTFFGKKVVIAVGRDITERKAAEHELLESHKSITLLAETALGFNEITSLTDFYNYLGEILHKLNPKAYIIINSIDNSNQLLKTETVYGESRRIKGVSSIIGYHPVGKTYRFDSSLFELSEGKVRKFSGGISELTFGQVPRTIAYAAEKLLNINSIHGIAIISNNLLVANATMVFPKRETIANVDTIEAFIKQASIAYNRINAEDKLRSSEEKYRQLAENTSDVVWTLDFNLKATYVSPSVETVIGESVSAHMAKTLEEKFPPEELQKLILILNEELENEKKHGFDPNRSRVIEAQHYKADGSLLWISMNVSFIRDSQGKPIGFHGISRDISKQKLAEQALLESETKFRTIAEQLTDLIAFVNEEGVLTYASPASKELFGLEPSEMLGNHFIKFLDKKSHPIALTSFMEVIEENKIITNLELSLLRSNNIVFAGEVTAKKHILNNQVIIIVTVRDISDRKKAQEQIANLASMLDLAPSAITVHDFKGNFIYSNQQNLEYHGYHLHEILKMNIRDIDSPDSAELIEKRVRDIKIYGEASFEVTHRRKDGTVFPLMLYVKQVNWMGKPAILSTGTEISERKKAEEALRASEEKYRLLIENQNDLIVKVDNEGRFLFVSPSYCKLFGKRESELIGQKFIPLVHQDDIESTLEIMQQLESPPYTCRLEQRAKTVNGWRWIEWVDKAMVDDNGRVIEIIGVGRDIHDRKMADISLKEKNTFIQTVLDNLPIGIALNNLDDSKATYTNIKFEEIYGWTAQEMHSIQSFFENVYPDKAYREELLARVMADIKSGDPKRMKWDSIMATRKDGTKRIINAVNIPLIEQNTMVSTVMDVTEQKIAEEKLTHWDKLMRYIIEHDNSAVAILDSDLSYVYVSQRYLNDYGIKGFEVVGKKVNELFPNLPPKWQDIFQRTLQGEVISNEEDTFTKSDGTLQWFRWECRPWYDANGSIGGVILYSEVITERKLAEKAIRESEARFRTFAQLAPIGIVISDKHENALYVSQKFVELFGYTINDIPDLESWLKRAYPDVTFRRKVQKEWNNAINKAIHQGTDVKPMEYPVTCKDGTIRQVEFRLASTGVLNFIIFTDITERKKALDALRESEHRLKEKNEEYLALNEELTESNEKINKINQELVAAREKAEQSDRLKTAFLANMSHEIRTPMNAIIGFADLLLNPSMTVEKKEFFTRILNTSCNQLLSVVDDVIDIAKIETGQMDIHLGKTNINSTISRIQQIFTPQTIQHGVQIRVSNSLPDSHADILTDPNKFGQILTNLVSNASKFTEEGYIDIGYQVKGENIEFYVKDSGIGIKPENFELIFERFHQVEMESNRQYGGTGLGLPISKAIIEMLGGRIWVESEYGKGSTFYFTLPYKPFYDNHDEDIIIKHTDFRFKEKTILIAEDEEANYIFIREILDEAGAISIHARNGLEAINLVNETSNIDLILMDIKMPKLNGIEATKEIRKSHPRIPIIALTAYAMSSDREECFKAGCVDYLSKPILRLELFQLIEKHLLKPK